MPTKIKKDSIEVNINVPDTLEAVLDPNWLAQALSPISGGAKVASVELTELVKAMAAKVRVAVRFENQPEVLHALCIKGFLDHDMGPGTGGVTTLREADFYIQLAPQISMLTPPCHAVIADREKNLCIFVMEDMIAAGCHFYNALEPFSVDQVAETLDQLARLHAATALLEKTPWIPNRMRALADRGGNLTIERMQELMHDARRADLPARTLDAALLMEGIKALADWNDTVPQTLLHGDCHPGNVYRTADGKLGFTDWQLIQKGNWALDVSYHIASVLPVELAEQEERNLLQHYLSALKKHGGENLSFDAAWELYKVAHILGFYQWAITQRVLPPITNQAFYRLGCAVTRHESYKILGL